MDEMHNSIAKALRALAIVVLVVGLIGSIVLGNVFGETVTYGYYYTHEKFEFSWSAFFTVIAVSVTDFILLLAFSEIIELLHHISVYTRDADMKLSKDTNRNGKSEVPVIQPGSPVEEKPKKPGYFDSLKPRI